MQDSLESITIYKFPFTCFLYQYFLYISDIYIMYIELLKYLNIMQYKLLLVTYVHT